MRMLVNVSNHTDADLELRVRYGKLLIKDAKQCYNDAADKGDINAGRMHQRYALYIQRCIDQSQQELDRRRT